jgi:hypothetical protein
LLCTEIDGGEKLWAEPQTLAAAQQFAFAGSCLLG